MSATCSTVRPAADDTYRNPKKVAEQLNGRQLNGKAPLEKWGKSPRKP